ncbi:MAG: competence/damage-inducible protein A [Nitrospiria bacterium]
MTQHGKNAAAIIIGNEILSGKVADQNAVYLARVLRSLGVDLQRVVVIPDNIEIIAEEVSNCRERVDLIFTSGGVGPTHDDVTMEGIASAIGRPLVRHPELVHLLRDVYSDILTPTQMKLADVPEGTELLYAEGLRIPVIHLQGIYIFPGIPELFVKKFEAIKERFREPPFHLVRIYLADKEEAIAENLITAVKRYPEILFGSYPILHQRDYKIILTLESKDRAYLEEALHFLISTLHEQCIFKIDHS